MLWVYMAARLEKILLSLLSVLITSSTGSATLMTRITTDTCLYDGLISLSWMDVLMDGYHVNLPMVYLEKELDASAF